MYHSECGDGFYQDPTISNNKQKAEYEQQVIRTKQDMSNALDDILYGDLPGRKVQR